MKTYPTRSEMARLNPDHLFTAVDYIYYVSTEAGLSPDFLASLCEVLDPKLAILDGVILVQAVGALDRYRKYTSEGQTPTQAQYWSNLLETTSLFGDTPLPEARRLAAVIASAWRSALHAQHPETQQEVRVMEDAAEGEVFVTLLSELPS